MKIYQITFRKRRHVALLNAIYTIPHGLPQTLLKYGSRDDGHFHAIMALIGRPSKIMVPEAKVKFF